MSKMSEQGQRDAGYSVKHGTNEIAKSEAQNDDGKNQQVNLNSKNFIKFDPQVFRNDNDPKKKKVAIMNSELLRSKVIERLKQGGYFTPREVESVSDELREKEELRIISTIEHLELMAHEVVRSQMS